MDGLMKSKTSQFRLREPARDDPFVCMTEDATTLNDPLVEWCSLLDPSMKYVSLSFRQTKKELLV